MLIEAWSDLASRQSLAEDVSARLRADARVDRLVPFGSLAGDPDIPDDLSDIDLDVFVRPGTTDLDLARSVVDVLADVAPVRAARTTWLRGFGYVVAVWFVGFPPYWHVDVRTRADRHTPDAAYGDADEWATGYTHWMLAVKRVVRSFRFLAEHRGTLTGEAPEMRIPAPVVDELRRLLSLHHRSTGAIAARGAFHDLCLEVDDALLEPAREELRST